VRPSDIDDLRADIATACRIMGTAGLAENILGHVSARVDGGRFLIRCRGPRERGLAYTGIDDVRMLAFDGSLDPGDGYKAPAELPLHTEILLTRPDVDAVVHGHPPAVVAADLAGLTLVPLVGAYNIPAARLAERGIPVYPRSVLIQRPELAREMAGTMRGKQACILRGHGITTAAETVRHALVHALNVDELARMTLAVASAGGTPTPIPTADFADLPELGGAFNVGLLWEHHVARLHGS
jgi:3,4-dihydroxyphthalate decarboxylase